MYSYFIIDIFNKITLNSKQFLSYFLKKKIFKRILNRGEVEGGVSIFHTLCVNICDVINQTDLNW